MSARMASSISLAAIVAVIFVAGITAGQAPAQTPRPPTVVVKVDGGFHWLDAGLGAVAALATALLVLGLALTVKHNGRSDP